MHNLVKESSSAVITHRARCTQFRRVQSAELKLKHSVHNAAQCTESSVHSVLSAFGIGVFHTALESALCTVCGVPPQSLFTKQKHRSGAQADGASLRAAFAIIFGKANAPGSCECNGSALVCILSFL